MCEFSLTPMPSILDQPADRDSIDRIAILSGFSAQELRQAKLNAGLEPDADAWIFSLLRLLPLAGILCLGGALYYLLYSQWSDLHRYIRFALAESLVLICLITAVFQKDDTLPKKALLFAGIFFMGPALFQLQIYRTGGDSYPLFAAWTLLSIPLAVAGRSPLFLLFSLGLAGISLMLFAAQKEFKNISLIYYIILFINAGFTAGIGFMRKKQPREAAWRRTERISGFFSISFAVIPAIAFIMDAGAQKDPGLTAAPVLFAAAILLIVWNYYIRSYDIYFLAMAALALIVVLSTAAGYRIIHSAADILLLCLFILAQAAVAAFLLRLAVKNREES